MLQELVDRVAVVTGAASGIGAALCRGLAAEGMRVVAADIDDDGARATAEATGALAVRVDVSDASSVAALADRAFDAFGQVDLLCNNAGVFQGGRTWELAPADWDWTLGVNVMGIVHGINAFVPRMIDQGTDGHVVNTASVAAIVSGPLSAPYVVSKAAAFTLSECLAHDLRSVGSRIGASVLVPSAVDTGIARTAAVRPERYGVDRTATGPAVSAILADMVAAGLHPDEVVGPVLDAVRNGTFVIATRPSYDAQVAGRFRALAARELPADLTVD
jgi:NAD(P)-dependent dehydrogenase (short-subunit alcohol dehydrogenase family)